MPPTVKRCLISAQKTTHRSQRPTRFGRRSANFFIPAVVKPLDICEIRPSEIGDLSTWHQRRTVLNATTAAFTPLQDAPLSLSAQSGPSPRPFCSLFFGESPALTFISLTP